MSQGKKLNYFRALLRNRERLSKRQKESRLSEGALSSRPMALAVAIEINRQRIFHEPNEPDIISDFHSRLMRAGPDDIEF